MAATEPARRSCASRRTPSTSITTADWRLRPDADQLLLCVGRLGDRHRRSGNRRALSARLFAVRRDGRRPRRRVHPDGLDERARSTSRTTRPRSAASPTSTCRCRVDRRAARAVADLGVRVAFSRASTWGSTWTPARQPTSATTPRGAPTSALACSSMTSRERRDDERVRLHAELDGAVDAAPSGSSWIDTAALAVRFRWGHVEPYAAVVAPLESDSHAIIFSLSPPASTRGSRRAASLACELDPTFAPLNAHSASFAMRTFSSSASLSGSVEPPRCATV